jgi:signal transduction histidine kinase
MDWGRRPLSVSFTESMTQTLALRDRPTVVAIALAGCALLGSSISFLGWLLDIPRLTDWLGVGISIQPNTCLLIGLTSAGVLLVQRRAWRGALTLGVLTSVASILILLQHVTGADLGLDELLLFGRTWGSGATLAAGRVGPPALFSLTLIGTALSVLGHAGLHPERTHVRRFVPVIGLAVCAIMIFSILGYVFGARQFYSIPWLTAIALPTASMLLAVGVALIASVPERDPLLLLRERSGAGALARVTIPTLAALIPVLLWLRVAGNEAGFYDVGTGRALGALALMTAVIAVLWVALLALRRHEKALRDADRRKDEFLATLAHELRNPLAPLTNAVAILSISQSESAIAGDARSMMSRQLKQLVRLIDDLLDVSRISSSRLDVRKERLQLQAVVEEVIEAMRPQCSACQQALALELPSRPVWIEADRIRLAQILTNLLSNASRYSGTGTLIQVRASCEGGEVLLSVRDQGIGIPREKLETIFEMFARVDSSLERASGGLGIGLYLVRRLAALHGGTITAHSEGLGMGSEFVVRLPIVVDEPSHAAHGAYDGSLEEARP